MTAIYMTRMMLYTFHGPNRTGDEGARAPARGAVGDDGAARRARRAERRSAAGSTCRLREVPPARSGDWSTGSEPVVGESATLRRGGGAPETRRVTEYGLVGLAVAIAVAGIALRVVRASSPPRSFPKARRRRKTASSACSTNKYYVDEIYDAAIVAAHGRRLARLLWRGIDAGLIDGLFVNGSAVAGAVRRMDRLAAAIRTGRERTPGCSSSACSPSSAPSLCADP